MKKLLLTLFQIFQKPIFRNKWLIAAIWFILPFIAGLKHILRGLNNNYNIFKYSYYHLIDQVNLYVEYPDQYFDTNHYGPFFSILIAPFAILPDCIGSMLWEVLLAGALFWAIYKLPVQWIAKVIIYWISFDAVFSDAVNSQTNALIAALIIGTFVLVRSGKDFWATLFIAIGLFVKLYGIVGLIFFLFSRKKIKFIYSFLFWSVICFVLPMVFSSPEFVIQSYVDWYHSLVEKDLSNAVSLMQNVSAIGMIFRLIGDTSISSLYVLIPAALLFGVQLLRTDLYQDSRYQLAMLASVLMAVVLFSTGSESCTYIIATVGFGIWFVLQNKPMSKYSVFLLIFMLALTIFASSDLSPSFIKKEIMRPYSLKALPFLLTWLTLVWQVFRLQKVRQSTLSDVYIEKP